MTGQWIVSPPPAFAEFKSVLTVNHTKLLQITQRHELRDLEAVLLSKVYSDVETGPVIYDTYDIRGSNKAQGARLDIHAREFEEL